jgi:hypothetical protein
VSGLIAVDCSVSLSMLTRANVTPLGPPPATRATRERLARAIARKSARASRNSRRSTRLVPIVTFAISALVPGPRSNGRTPQYAQVAVGRQDGDLLTVGRFMRRRIASYELKASRTAHATSRAKYDSLLRHSPLPVQKLIAHIYA